VFIVLEVVDRLVSATVWDVEPAPNISVMPVTSQSPAVSDMLVQFFAVPDVSETFEPFVAATYSPILPDAALSFVEVPVIGPESASLLLKPNRAESPVEMRSSSAGVMQARNAGHHQVVLSYPVHIETLQ